MDEVKGGGRRTFRSNDGFFYKSKAGVDAGDKLGVEAAEKEKRVTMVVEVMKIC